MYIGSKHRLRISQPWLGSAPIPLRKEIDCYERNHTSPFSSRYLPKSWSNHSLWLHETQGENYTSLHWSKTWTMSSTGIKRCWSFTPVQSRQSKLLKSSEIKDISVRQLDNESPIWLYCVVGMQDHPGVSLSWFDHSAWTSLHWPLITFTAFSPSLKPLQITSSFCRWSWTWTSLQKVTDIKLRRLPSVKNM